MRLADGGMSDPGGDGDGNGFELCGGSAHIATGAKVKRGAPDHDKMFDLARRLHVALYSANGLMERLWHYTAKRYPQGNIGSATDEYIARACAWGGDPSRLTMAMVGAGWLDPCPTHRFHIHNWLEHMDTACKKQLERKGLSAFLSGQCLDMSGQSSDSGQTKNPCLALALPEPSHIPPIPQGGVLELAPPEPKQRVRKPQAEAIPESPEFVEFYLAYWKHEGRDDAWKSYREQVHNGDHAKIMQAVRELTPEMLNREKKYRPAPAVWLNGHRWRDREGVTEPQNGNGSHAPTTERKPNILPLLFDPRLVKE